MTRIPVKFDRIAAAFNEAARAPPLRSCESSGSDHSPEELTNLSDLVNSFIESDWEVEIDDQLGKIEKQMGNENNESEDYNYSSDSEEDKDILRGLLGELDDEKQKIRLQTQLAYDTIPNKSSSENIKRQLMSRLRHMGFDAGLCKCRWQKSGDRPAGSYEYIDVNVSGTRYIIEVNLSGEFEIARPTASYTSLINIFPQTFVGKSEELKKIVRLMSRRIRQSMKSMDLKVPPWRRNGYMQAKWFARYKRTTNEISTKIASQTYGELATKRSVGFLTLPTISYYCKDDFAGKVVPRVSYLTAAFTGN